MCVAITLTPVSLLYSVTPVVCVTDTNNLLQQTRQFKKVPQLQRSIIRTYKKYTLCSNVAVCRNAINTSPNLSIISTTISTAYERFKDSGKDRPRDELSWYQLTQRVTSSAHNIYGYITSLSQIPCHDLQYTQTPYCTHCV